METTETTEFLKMVIEHSTEKIFFINQKGLITVAVNQSDDNLIGKSIISCISKSHIDRMTSSINEAFNSGKPVSCELKAGFGSEKMGWFSCRISPIFQGNEVQSAIVFASDITERRAAHLAARNKARSKQKNAEERARALANILTMCAKTKKVRFKGEWLRIEDFLWKRYGFRISHGLSPQALKEELEIIDDKDFPHK